MAERGHLRPVTLEDAPAVNALMRSVWWPERSLAGWRWLAENPARLAQDEPAPLGWVIDRGDGPEAFTGNVVQRFWRGDDSAFAATGHSIIVPPKLLGRSRGLIQATLDQPGLFCAYTFNANPLSHRLYGRFGMERWPDPTHGLKLSWVTDSATLLRARLLGALERRRGFSGAKGRERLMNRRLGERSLGWAAPGVAVLDDLGDQSDYAVFWNRLRAEGGVIADRSPRTLRWRLADPDAPRRPVILAHRGAGGLDGWLLAMIGKGSEIEAPTLEVLDLAALGCEPDVVQALLSTALRNAGRWGAAKVRLQVISPRLRCALGPLAARARREGGWGHCHARFAGAWADAARRSWSPTPFDGDYGVCIRPAPPVDQPAAVATAPSPGMLPA